ncbi:Salicylate synthase [Hyella patelloides LEGE 07179]|uniref:Salicylate synthase n=1 Tax=Hyella patelloides LEGE 07179 TaxID=945734 RepID=A0A563VWH0_9CYAN|nr:salicylate synthase [Hyella patelloides]VEP15737.1 Salicylate synthase [Hyella patelloides LEGE 07179]
MVTNLESVKSYREELLPSKLKPIEILYNLLEGGIFSNYVMYEKDGEVRIAGNELAKVSVSKTEVCLEGMGKFNSQPATDPFKQVEELLALLPLENWTAYGYVAFDMASFYSSYSKAIAQPLLHFLIPETELLITDEGVRIKSVKPLTQIRDLLSTDSKLPKYSPMSLTEDATDCENYSQRVDQLKDAIKQNKLHKAIISRSRKFTGNLDILGTYVVGAEANNSARSYCLDFGDVKAVGFSPEILMRVDEGGFVITNPLAATRPRGESKAEDRRLHDELFTDAKEVKEHALSIWLAQDELNSVCLPETVQIFDFMEVKKYRCVQHLSSRAGGQLMPGKTLWDALKVLFPGITVSGIDKQKALAWIDRLEDEPRGIYAGGIGWVDSNGTADIAIAIRSVYQYNKEIYLNAGAGIVAESVLLKEYIESVNKMNTMLTKLVLQT